MSTFSCAASSRSSGARPCCAHPRFACRADLARLAANRARHVILLAQFVENRAANARGREGAEGETARWHRSLRAPSSGRSCRRSPVRRSRRAPRACATPDAPHDARVRDAPRAGDRARRLLAGLIGLPELGVHGRRSLGRSGGHDQSTRSGRGSPGQRAHHDIVSSNRCWRTGRRVGEGHPRAERGIERRIGWHGAGKAQRHAEKLTGTGVDGVEAASGFASLMSIDEYIHRKGTVPGVHRLAECVGRRRDRSDRAPADTASRRSSACGVIAAEHGVESCTAVDHHEVHAMRPARRGDACRRGVRRR